MPPSDDPHFYSPYSETLVGRNRLPHWDQQGCTYALTFRLADSVPAPLLRQHRFDENEWRKRNPEPWSPKITREYHQRFTRAIDRWMDQGIGECYLHRPGCAHIVGEALQFFEGERTRVHAWIVMPNHVHVLAQILDGHGLSTVMESWKGFTARTINRHLNRAGTLWQKGYYDRLVRDWDHFGNVVRYVRKNPMLAGLPPASCLSGESALASRF
ncbi:MAG: transposase [Verrucomicrobiales bacterium]